MLLWWSLLQRLVLHSSTSGPNMIMMIKLWSYHHEHDYHSNISQDENVASSAPGLRLNNIGTQYYHHDHRITVISIKMNFLLFSAWCYTRQHRDSPPTSGLSLTPSPPCRSHLLRTSSSQDPGHITSDLVLHILCPLKNLLWAWNSYGLPRVQGLWQLHHHQHNHHLQRLHDLPPNHWVFCDPIKVD